LEIYERIKLLRKNHLKLSQTEFGERLGVSRSVINNIERDVLARPEQKASLYKLMCTVFNVNEDWLLNGTEPMFIEPDTFNLDELARAHGCDELERQIIKAYFEIDEGTRRGLIEHFKERLAEYNEPASGPAPGAVSSAEAAYEKSLGVAPASASTASNTTAATDDEKDAG